MADYGRDYGPVSAHFLVDLLAVPFPPFKFLQLILVDIERLGVMLMQSILVDFERLSVMLMQPILVEFERLASC